MFLGCSSLKELDLSNFDTQYVTNMCNLFFQCSSLKELNLGNFNTNNVTNLDGMFFRCPEDLKKKIKEKYKNINIK